MANSRNRDKTRRRRLPTARESRDWQNGPDPDSDEGLRLHLKMVEDDVKRLNAHLREKGIDAQLPEDSGQPAYEDLLNVVAAAVACVHFERYAHVDTLRAMYYADQTGKPAIFSDDDTFGCVALSGETIQITGADERRSIEEMKIWGFTQTGTERPVVHYWRDDTCPVERACIFFAHELSHGFIERLLKTTNYRPNDELLADAVSAVAARARRLAEGIEKSPVPET